MTVETVKDLNKELKTLITFEELDKFLQKLADLDYSLKSKRSYRYAFGFEADEYNPKKVKYLFNDGASRGRCQITNLWRFLTVKH